MRKLDNYIRVRRLIESAINDFALNLGEISVLTEAASGAFVVTPLIAALAGADRVIAVTKDSRYGLANEVKEYTENWAKKFGVGGRITVANEPAHMYAHSVDLVTNLGFVRPIDEKLIKRLPPHAAIALMWEPWEFRASDIDLVACRKKQIPVLGTCETHPRLQIFRYIGLLALKLLLEAGIEVFRSNILLIGSGHFGLETKHVLNSNGCHPVHLNPLENWDNRDQDIKCYIQNADAVVVVEHQATFSLLGGDEGLPLAWFDDSDAVIIHICGKVDDAGLERQGIRKIPKRKVEPGFMTVTTDYVGPRPVIDLHTAGLKVGEALVRGLRLFDDSDEAIKYALNNSPAMDFD